MSPSAMVWPSYVFLMVFEQQLISLLGLLMDFVVNKKNIECHKTEMKS